MKEPFVNIVSLMLTRFRHQPQIGEWDRRTSFMHVWTLGRRKPAVAARNDASAMTAGCDPAEAMSKRARTPRHSAI
jgi:hypothetical protein